MSLMPFPARHRLQALAFLLVAAPASMVQASRSPGTSASVTIGNVVSSASVQNQPPRPLSVSATTSVSPSALTSTPRIERTAMMSPVWIDVIASSITESVEGAEAREALDSRLVDGVSVLGDRAAARLNEEGSRRE